MDSTPLVAFRHGLYDCWDRGRDVLMNTADALIAEAGARSFAELSLSPWFTRQWPSLYQGLQHGRCDRVALRRHFLEYAPLTPAAGAAEPSAGDSIVLLGI